MLQSAFHKGLCLIVTAGILLFPLIVCQAQPATDHQLVLSQYLKAREQFRQQLTEMREIGTREQDTNLTESAKALLDGMDVRVGTVRQWPSSMKPKQINSPETSNRLVQLNRIASDHALTIHQLGTRIQVIDPVLAYRMYQESLAADTDCEQSRKKLGYIADQGEWVTPFIKKKRSLNYVDHPEFGWIKTSEVARFEAGDRNYKSRWIPAAREAELRREFRNAWTIQTEHFLIKTNHSLEAGVTLGRELEVFHTYFHDAFLPVFNTPAQLLKLFDSTERVITPVSSLHKVVYYRDRDEYIKALKQRVPNVEVTNALYWNDDRTAYSYYDPTRPDFSSLFHEATHQLLYESVSQHRAIAATSNFWIIEGIACYMETFRKQNGQLMTGDPHSARVRQTLGQFVQEGWHIPLEKFVKMGREDFQTAPFKELQKRYGEAATLAYFFMDYENGKYRPALLEHISNLYSLNQQQRQTPFALDVLLNTPFETLDQQYRDFLTATAGSNVQVNTAPAN